MKRTVYGLIGAGALLVGSIGSEAPGSMAYKQLPFKPAPLTRTYPGVDSDASYCYSSLVTASFASLQGRSSWGREYLVDDVPLELRAEVEGILDADADGIITEREACDAMSAVAGVAVHEDQGFRAFDVLREYGVERAHETQD